MHPAESQDARITDEIPHHEISSAYQESGFEGSHHLHDNSSSVQMENQLLKNEIVSLNREMQTIIRRIQSTQDGELCSTLSVFLSLGFCVVSVFQYQYFCHISCHFYYYYY